MNVLVLCSYFQPAYKAGGPIRSIAGAVESLGDEVNFWIITRDRDWGERARLEGVRPGLWQEVGKAKVLYLSPRSALFAGLWRAIRACSFDLIYFNSFFDPLFTIVPLFLRRLRLIKACPVIMAPRGEFSAGALAIKRFKKWSYLRFALGAGLCRETYWQASSEGEREDILKTFFGETEGASRLDQDVVAIIRNISVVPEIGMLPRIGSALDKQMGRLRLVFLGRVSEMKNIDFALRVLATVRCRASFDLFGPIERNSAYWEECRELIAKLPPNVEAHYHGSIDPADVPHVFATHDLLFLPTRGENFGHAILESLGSGCPVLISDRTPWRDLERYDAGWALPLENPDRFRELIEALAPMSAEEFERHRSGARAYAKDKSRHDEAVRETRAMLRRAVAGGSERRDVIGAA